MVEIAKKTEIAAMRDWLDGSFIKPAGDGEWVSFPLTFDYGGTPSVSLFPEWDIRIDSSQNDLNAAYGTITATDPDTGLECRCEFKAYKAYPAIEWLVYFKNNGSADTPILSNIQPLDTIFATAPGAACRVHHARGGLTQTDDFAPLETFLTFRQGGSKLELAAGTGKCSTLHLPFFNLETGGGGVIGAIGWSGGWAARFQRMRRGVHVCAGMERTHLRLHPGEEIRTPRILLLFWKGDGDSGLREDRVRGHNMLRRLILEHYTPRPGGKPMIPPFCEGAWGAASVSTHLAKIRWLEKHSIPTECYWIDAGWYGQRPIAETADANSGGWMKQVGSWSVNAEAYPEGLEPIGKAAASAGLGFLLWVEPERAFEGSELASSHPEWLIGPVKSGNVDGHNYMMNLGIPEARRYITDLVSGIIEKNGLTCYRQDFNDLKVPELLELADTDDRIGMTEIGHITGLYAFWDELLRRHPGLVIDNCAGGGQRIDLETISRTVPLWRSDLQCFPFDPMAMQTQTQGLAPWVPLSAAVWGPPTAYAMRSAAGPAIVTHFSSRAIDNGADLPVETIRNLMKEALMLRDYFYGDFYPLLSFSLAEDAWAAWQYDLPEKRAGVVLAFRRHRAPFPQLTAKLEGLDADAVYELRSLDDGRTQNLTGRELMEDGIPVIIDSMPGSALFAYKHAG